MADKIQIANWLLTRKCNLKCSYCSITKNYDEKPIVYPDMSYYYKNEMTTEYVINGLRLLKNHNSNCFHIFYGGEPLLFQGLTEIIDFCNRENIYYTIISNNSPEVQPRIEKLFEEVGFVYGFTGSVDPVLICGDPDDDRTKKSRYAIEQFSKLKPYVKDLVAEMTVSNESIPYLFDTIKYLTDLGVSTDITYIDIAKNDYYDFSSIRDTSQLVYFTYDLEKQLELILKNNLDIILKDQILEISKSVLPSNYDCQLEKDLHNITIDADGSLRLCLRCRGASSPKIKLHQIFLKDHSLNQFTRELVALDKYLHCLKCNWTCSVMSYYLSNDKTTINELSHLEKRGLLNG